MLLVLGVDSEFCNVEALVTGIVDNWPDQLLKHRRKFTVALCAFLFCLGIPLITNVGVKLYLFLVHNYSIKGGIFMFQLMDFYSCSGMFLNLGLAFSVTILSMKWVICDEMILSTFEDLKFMTKIWCLIW